MGRTGTRVDEVPDEILKMTPEKRLAYIVRDGELLAFPPFGGSQPVVCFSECTQYGITKLVSSRRYGPWGLAFHKDAVFGLGGGPAFYVRGDEWPHVAKMPAEVRFRAARFWPGAEPEEGEDLPDHLAKESDWLHEREWRVCGRGDPPKIDIETSDVAFLIVRTRAFRDDLGRWIHDSRGPGEEIPFADIPLVEMDSEGTLLMDETDLWISTQC